MTGKEYLERVVGTVAAYGNRDNDNFVSAFSIAQKLLEQPVVHYFDVLRVDRQIRQGLEHFTQGARYFDGHTRYAYETLTMFFSGNEAEWKAAR